MITRDQVINDVVSRHPETVEVFTRFRVDACCGGAHSIAETARANGLVDLTPLLHALNRTARGLGEKPLGDIIEEIESTHHDYLKQELPALHDLVVRLTAEAEGGPAAGPAGELHHTVGELAREIAEHLFKEEQILFPTIQRLEAALGGDASIDSDFIGCGTQGPVAQMHFEHEQAKGGLDRIGGALEALEATEHVAEATATLRPRLERLRDDLLEHIRAEEEDLFPRALDLETQAIARMGQRLEG